MDTAIGGGDFVVGSNGLPHLISEKEELLQRAYILLRVPLGGLCYNKALGSEIPLLPYNDEFTVRAQQAAREALRSLPDISVSGVSADFSGSDAVCTVYLTSDLYGPLEITLELPKEENRGDV